MSTSANYTTSIKAQQKSLHFSIFPNPSTGRIQLYNAKKDMLNIRVMDAKGAELKNFTSTDRIVEMDLESGVNLVQIRTNEGVQTEKVIVF